MQHPTTTPRRSDPARPDRSRLRAVLRALADETAEGVISTAIAVLVLAFVGAAMWVGFNAMMGSTCDAAADQLESSIGNGSSSIDCQ